MMMRALIVPILSLTAPIYVSGFNGFSRLGNRHLHKDNESFASNRLMPKPNLSPNHHMRPSSSSSTYLSNSIISPSFLCPSTITTNPRTMMVAWVLTTVIGGVIPAPLVVIKATNSWYNKIPLPTYTPPKFIFAPVWSTLYTFMGIASWRIYQMVQKNIIATTAAAAETTTIGFGTVISSSFVLKLSLLHYVMNLSWAPIFFGLKRLRAGHVLNVLLILTLVPIMILYGQMDPLASALLVPYFLWTSFATVLSRGICKLNPTSTMHGSWYNNAKLQDDICKLQAAAASNIGL